MGIPVAYSVNCGFGWFIVLLATAGYFLTWRRMRERWSFWIILAVGWAFHPQAMKELRHEADAFLAKPASSKQILSQVSSALQGIRQLQL